jgi:hypothetical protein
MFNSIKNSIELLNKSTADAIEDELKKAHVLTSLLEKEYTPDGLTFMEKAVNDYALLSNFQTAASIGEELFAYSQLFSLLRRFPSQKWRMDYLSDKILEYNEFAGYDKIQEVVLEAYRENLINKFINSEEYQELLNSDPDAAAAALKAEQDLILTQEAHEIYQPEVDRIMDATFLNSLIRGDVIRDIRPTGKSVFENMAALSIPHVFSAWSSLRKLRSVIGSAFMIHNERVAALASSIVTRANLYGSGDKGVSLPKAQRIDEVKKELVKMLTSELELEFAEGNLNLYVDPNTKALIQGVTYHNVEAWSQLFVREVEKLPQTNEFIKHLEVKTDQSGLKSLGITADKIRDPEYLEMLREGFEDLMDTNREIAMDIFKYAIRTQGLGFGTSNLSQIFPTSLIAEYSRQLDRMFESLMPTNKQGQIIINRAARNLSILEDQFLFQFLRNNGGQVGYIADASPIPTGTFSQSGKQKESFSGVDERDGGYIYYDLKYPNDGKVWPEHIRRFGEDVFVKLDVPGMENYVYYRLLNTKGSHAYYSYNENLIGEPFRMSFFTEPNNNIQDISTYQDGYLKFVGSGSTVIPGEKVYLIDRTSPTPDNMLVVEVTGKQTQKEGYSVVPVKIIQRDASIFEANPRESQALKYLDQVVTNSNVSQRMSRASVELSVRKSKKKSPAYGIVSDLQEGANLTRLAILPLNEVKPDMTLEERKRILEGVNTELDKIPKRSELFVQASLLDAIEAIDKPLALAIASSLAVRFGYTHPILRDQTLDDSVDVIDNYSEYDRINREATIANGIDLGGIDFTYDSQELAFVKHKHAMSKRIWGKIKSGQVVADGLSEKGVRMYAHVVKKTEDAVFFHTIDKLIFDKLTKPSYTVEEMQQIQRENNPC